MRNKSDFLYSFYSLVVYLFLPLHFPQLFPIYCVEGCLQIEEETSELFSFLCICFLSCVLIYMYMYVIHRDSSSSESRLCFWQYFLSLYLPPSLAFPLASLRRSYILYSVYYPLTVAYFVCYFSFSSVFRKALSILYFCLLFLLVLFKLLLCNYSYFIFYPASACCFPPL